uniref:Uncharacterized protein n=1 Tax=Rhizophora mucronata TaxID=61149 RepID=A0A2P2LSI7_RHIMU
MNVGKAIRNHSSVFQDNIHINVISLFVKTSNVFIKMPFHSLLLGRES